MAGHMRAWHITGPGPVEKTLALVDGVPRPSAKHLQHGQVLVRISRAALNPVDYKVPELGIASKAVVHFPKTPGIDFSGQVVDVAPDATAADDVKPGDFVLGRILLGKTEGSLAQYAVVNRDSYVALPKTFTDLDRAAGLSTAAMTAYGSIAPHVNVGDRVFINGGSGGVGLFGIQVAKALGCHVTVSASTAKAPLCREVGADDIIDYKAGDVLEELKKKGQVHSLIVDNVGNSPPNLYASSHNFLLPKGKYVFVGGAISSGSVMSLAKSLLLPGFLGGGKRKFIAFSVHSNRHALEQVVQWMVEGKLKTVVDSVYNFEEADKAFEHLKKGASAGKVIVRVDEEN
jgi:NADPH:quinone reductase-like Zn-dependent oxidoreductase